MQAKGYWSDGQFLKEKKSNGRFRSTDFAPMFLRDNNNKKRERDLVFKAT
jgi:hypothetical protein